MKTTLLILLPLLLATTGRSLDAVPLDAKLADVPSFSIAERGPHHRIWTNSARGTYTELATGMHYLSNGHWVESSEEIEILNGVGLARQGQHQVIFAPTLGSTPCIDLSAPDGKRFQSRVTGIAYFDRASGQGAWIGETKNAEGLVLGANQVIYPDAFTTTRADMRYTYTKYGLEQDLILREQPPSPAQFGLNPGTTLIQVWTEFFGPPAPLASTRIIYQEPDPLARQAMAMPDLLDENLGFDATEIRQGIAFTIGDDGRGPMQSDGQIPVCKQWATVAARDFLIESVPYEWLKPLLTALPAPQAAVGRPNQAAPFAGKIRASRPQLLASLAKPAPQGRAALQPAQLGQMTKGTAVVLDYAVLNVNLTNYTFQGGGTYYVSGPVILSGTNNVFEAGTVIKFSPTNAPRLTITSPPKWQGTSYLPVVLSARDDSTVGEVIGSAALSGYYADTALDLDATTANAAFTLPNLRVTHANTAIKITGYTGHTFSHAQFVNCATGIKPVNTVFNLRNALFYNVLTNFDATTSTGNCEHVTVDIAAWFNKNSALTLNLTNSLLVAVTNAGSYTAQSVSTATSGNSIFQVVGAGYHYLVDGTYRNLGTTNINPSLAADLKLMTTHAPVLLTNNFTVNTTLLPQAGRNTGIPDLGYHYWPVDYFWFALSVANTTLVLTNGVCVGFYGKEGTEMKSGGIAISEGSPLNMNHLVYYTSVQENTNVWGELTTFFNIFRVSTTTAVTPVVQCRFTDAPWLATTGGRKNFMGTVSYSSKLSLKDCWLRGPNLYYTNADSTQLPSVAMTNTLSVRCVHFFTQGTSNGVTLPVAAYMRNNLVWGSLVAFTYHTNDGSFDIRDNFFDTTTITFGGEVNVPSSNNGYVGGQSIPGGTNDQRMSAWSDYQTGPLGGFYYPTNGVNGGLTNLINKGSRTADLSGLYHYTTTTNQVKETNSVVDIGFHYVALDASGKPLDGDGDGLPDYFEDRNGNGTYDTGDISNWTVADTDGDGVSDFIEWLQGRNPLVGATNDANLTIKLRVFTPLK